MRLINYEDKVLINLDNVSTLEVVQRFSNDYNITNNSHKLVVNGTNEVLYGTEEELKGIIKEIDEFHEEDDFCVQVSIL